MAPTKQTAVRPSTYEDLFRKARALREAAYAAAEAAERATRAAEKAMAAAKAAKAAYFDMLPPLKPE